MWGVVFSSIDWFFRQVDLLVRFLIRKSNKSTLVFVTGLLKTVKFRMNFFYMGSSHVAYLSTLFGNSDKTHYDPSYPSICMFILQPSNLSVSNLERLSLRPKDLTVLFYFFSEYFLTPGLQVPQAQCTFFFADQGICLW